MISKLYLVPLPNLGKTAVLAKDVKKRRPCELATIGPSINGPMSWIAVQDWKMRDLHRYTVAIIRNIRFKNK